MMVRPLNPKGFNPKRVTDYTGRVSASPCVTPMGASQVTCTVHVEDVYGFPSVLCHLKLSVEEARGIAFRLTEAATKAEEMAQAEATKGA